MLLNLVLVLTATGTGSARLDCRNPVDPARRVDTTFVRVADVDNDSSPDTVRLRLTAPRFDAPFTRVFSIISKGRVILSSSKVDEWLDSTFKEISFALPCTGYLQCKCTWYSGTILAGVIQRGSRLGPAVFDPGAPNSIYRTAAEDLIRRCGATPASAEAAIGRAVARLRDGAGVFVVEPLTPATAAAPIAWFPEFSCFATIYRE
ncbi:MAG: hypothetical protein ACRENP_27740 [Longimicrobiales bacterium]